MYLLVLDLVAIKPGNRLVESRVLRASEDLLHRPRECDDMSIRIAPVRFRLGAELLRDLARLLRMPPSILPHYAVSRRKAITLAGVWPETIVATCRAHASNAARFSSANEWR